MAEENLTIWTIGHSTRAIEDFLALLKAHKIESLVDVRHFPGSRRYPHFNKEVFNTTIWPNSAAADDRAPTRTIPHGEMRLFAAMLITWKQTHFPKESPTCSI
jgi:hypothetical protein